MKKYGFGAVLAVLATVMLAAGAGTNPEAERLLKVATNMAVVDGNLKGAIAQYQQIVDAYGKADRTTAAQALLRMAECYQKLGDTQARSTYERVIREYADQKESVALARTRLGVSEPARMTSRRVTSVPVGGVGYGTVSPDGRYFPHTNWENGDLFLRDLVTGNDRRLTNISGLSRGGSSEFAAQSVFSRDGRQLAYSWAIGRGAEIRIIDVSGDGAAQPRRVFGNEDISGIWPDDWSSDGRWLAVQVRRQDKTAQIGLLDVRDGSLRVLKSVDWRGATRLMFSPDGKYLAYDLPVSEADNRRDVFILAVDGSREIGAVVHPANDQVMGWSADGSTLLFSSDRTDAVGLWQLRVAGGRPNGAPDLIKQQIEGAPLGVATNGALYLLVHHPRFNSAVSADIRVTALDFETGRFLSPPVAPVHQFVGANNYPVWSPDGKHLAYVSRREGATESGGGSNRFIIAIRSVETGQLRELRPALTMYPPVVRWAPDGRSLLTHGRDSKGRQGLYRVDAQNGAVSVIALGTADIEIRSPAESLDGQKIYYMRRYIGQPEKEFTLVERDVAGGSEREVIRGQGIRATPFSPLLSPDGQSLVVWRDDPATRSSALLIVPRSGGQPKEIIRVDSPRRAAVQSWTPDGRAILVTITESVDSPGVSSPRAAPELWRVPLDGSERRKLDLNVAGMTEFSLHPDGRQVAYGVTEPAKDDEVWVLENFLPTAKK